ncbi:hypothetical protein ACHAWF_017421 [Thalassiosira exigua]
MDQPIVTCEPCLVSAIAVRDRSIAPRLCPAAPPKAKADQRTAADHEPLFQAGRGDRRRRRLLGRDGPLDRTRRKASDEAMASAGDDEATGPPPRPGRRRRRRPWGSDGRRTRPASASASFSAAAAALALSPLLSSPASSPGPVAASASAAGEGAWDSMRSSRQRQQQQLQQQRQQQLQQRRHQQQHQPQQPRPHRLRSRPSPRRLETTYYPHYVPSPADSTCTNARPREPWDPDPKPNLRSCCAASYQWDVRGCVERGEALLAAEGGDEAGGEMGDAGDEGGVAAAGGSAAVRVSYPWLPSHDEGTCHDAAPARYGQTSYGSLKKCCGKVFKHATESCLRKGEEAKFRAAFEDAWDDEASGVHPWIADWGAGKCTNARAKEEWEAGYVTVDECCEAHFGYQKVECAGIPDGAANDAAGDASDGAGDEDEGDGDVAWGIGAAHEETWWFPSWPRGHCVTDRRETPPEYMTNDPEGQMWKTYKECCATNFPGSEEECLEVSGEMAPPTRPPAVLDADEGGSAGLDIGGGGDSSRYYWPAYLDGYCELDGDDAPRSMRKDPETYFATTAGECCREHFPDRKKACVQASPVLPEVDEGTTYGNAGGSDGGGNGVPANPARYRYHYYPRLSDVSCVKNVDLTAPAYTYDSPGVYFYVTYESCCSTTFEREEWECRTNSEAVERGAPHGGAPGAWGDAAADASGGALAPRVLVEFGGKLYFRNAFVPHSSRENMRVVRDATLNSVKISLGEDYPVATTKGLTFDGINVEDLDEALAGRRLRGASAGSSVEDRELASRKLERLQLFRFEVSVSLPCDASCLADVSSAGRNLSFDVADRFDSAVRDGSLFRTLTEDLTSMGLVGPFARATLDEGFLQYEGSGYDPRYTAAPTAGPEVRSYRVDVDAGTCLADGTRDEGSDSSYDSLEECCKFPWLDEEECLAKGRSSAAADSENSSENNDSQAHPYHVDMGERTCLADGNHDEDSDHLYDTLEDCCKFPWLDEDECLAKGRVDAVADPTENGDPPARPYRVDVGEGTCLADGNRDEESDYLYDTLEECCQFPWLDEDECLTKGALLLQTPPPAPSPTRTPTREPSPNPTKRPTNKPTAPPYYHDASDWPTFSPTTEEATTAPPTEVPTRSPVLPPTRSPTGRNAPAAGQQDASGGGTCGEYGWHIDRSTGAGCTDNDDVAPGWLLNSGTQARMFKETADECCREFFSGRACEKRACDKGEDGGDDGNGEGAVDVAPPPAPSTDEDPEGGSEEGPSTGDTCGGRGWHVDRTSNDGCSNDDHYPQAWLRPSLLPKMFFQDVSACCKKFFKTSECPIYSCEGATAGGIQEEPATAPPTPDPTPAPVKPPTPSPTRNPVEPPPAELCTGRGWHVNKKTYDGCSNDVGPDDKYFFTTAENCCSAFFKHKECNVYDLCGDANANVDQDSPATAPEPAPAPTDPPMDMAGPTAEQNDAIDATSFAEDFEGGDLSSTQFTTSASLPWVIDNAVAYKGQKSVRNSLTSRGESSQLALTMDFPSDGEVLYQLRTDVYMPWALFEVKVDQRVVSAVAGHDGEPKWTTTKVPVSKGVHEVAWVVSTKDMDMPSEQRGSGTVWIDDVKFVETPVFRFDDGVFDPNFFSFSGIGRWKIDDSLPGDQDGLAAHSPMGLLPGEQSTMVMDWDSPTGGIVSFDCHLGLGKITFYVDGTPRFSEAQPGKGTQRVDIIISPGRQTLSWEYKPPSLANMPLSAAWIDNIIFTV